ncbi:EH signature domain-containing protein [Phenylobacterium sp.]|uniref:EH signature domain-containing protein n=1 Tax=Phenylobacterium sp. TaxID=1871053 RepID=UPI0035ADD991
MKGLAALLAQPDRLLRRLAASAPEPLAMHRAARKIEAEASDGPSSVDVAALQSLVALAVSEDRLASLSRRDLRETCRAFLQPPHPPGRDRRLSLPIIAEVERLQRRAAFLALIDVYLDRFSPDDTDVAFLGKRLEGLSSRWPWRDTDAWPQRARQYLIFDAARAPERLTRAVMDSAEPPQSILQSAGLQSEGRLRGGLAEAAFRLGCISVQGKKESRATPLQTRLIAWSRLGGSAYAYPRAWTEFAGALFRPWETNEPKGEHKATLLDAAISYAGDPRVQPARWSVVRAQAPDAYDVIVRWLTKASVEQFFDIVAETTDRPDMWAERREFWERYLHADHISAAWVAFGADGAWRAEQAASRSNDTGLSMFGRLASGGSRTAEHAALIMKIGDLTVVEWSHNGRWNMWRHGDRGHPALFRHNSRRRPDYEPRELMNAPLWGAHQGDWRWKVRELIRHETGVTV